MILPSEIKLKNDYLHYHLQSLPLVISIDRTYYYIEYKCLKTILIS